MGQKYTAEERLAWLEKRMDYFEHRDAANVAAANQPSGSGFWSHSVTSDNWVDTCPASNEQPDCADMNLVEYIDMMLDREGTP
jgi:hypothetical protein